MGLSVCRSQVTIDTKRSAEGYTAGGARGDVPRGTVEEPERRTGASSSVFVTVTMAMTGDLVMTAEPAVEQNGHT
jgi:hypothetical protein